MTDVLASSPDDGTTTAAIPDKQSAPTDQQLSRSFRAMGCQMSLTVITAQAAQGQVVLEIGQAMMAEIEARLSRFRADSELSRLNAGAGSWSTVSPLLATVLAVALRAARRTGGLCSPTLLSALEAAGYSQDFGTVSAAPAGARGRPEPVLRATDAPRHVRARRLRPTRQPGRAGRAWRAIRRAERGTQVCLPPGARLDLAGVAKGWAADRVADLLALAGPCVVDGGGDLAVRAAPPGLLGWPVAIASPFAPDSDLAMVQLRDAGIATSGVDFRRWSLNGQPQHHLIDPRTGAPSQTDVLTASVVAPTTVEADIHAKAALMLGTAGGLAYLRRGRLAGLIVRRDARIFTSPRWNEYALDI